MTNSTFRSRALTSGLVSEGDLARCEAALLEDATGSPPTATATDQAIAEKLVEFGVVTAYQAQQLCDGRTRFDVGSYVITDWIGQGSMAHVYKAVHKVLGQEYALKVLPLDKSNPQAIQNFTCGIRQQANLFHPNLVRTCDAGHHGNVHYVVTEYAGMDLRRRIHSQGPIGGHEAANIILQASLGLEFAHQNGLVHHHVTPRNVLVSSTGIAKVSDVGLMASMLDKEKDLRLETPDFLSPEQIRTPHDVSKLSDIYSLGCTLYYIITGKVPFPGGTAANKIERICSKTPWHPRQFVPEIKEEFVEVIAAMIEKDPANRIQSAAEAAKRLESWA